MAKNNKSNIMVVDDLVEDTKLLTQILTENNYLVRPFLSGKLALRSIKIEPPDLLLLDINMPGMDGYELAKQIQNLPELRRLPIIFISAHQDIDVKTKAFEHGGVDYISKPFQAQELISRVKLHLKLEKQNADLEKANTELKALSQAKSRFLSSVSHEIRTPMNAILGFAELLQYSENLSEQEKGDLETIANSGEHLLALINDVLEMSKIESGHINIQPVVMNLNELIREIDTMFRLPAKDKNLQFIIERNEQLNQPIVADRSKLKQILINLLSNALKFTDQGSIRISAKLSNHLDTTLSKQAKLNIIVEDTGVGIADHEITQVFKSFEQTQSGRDSEQGTGLGLAISRQYAQLMGGDISVNSCLGKGTAFKVTTICELSNQKPLSHTTNKNARVIGLTPGHPRYRLLITDDIQTNRMILKRMLMPLDIDIKEACNGKEALEIFYQWHPDLIITDMQMPIMNGYELVSIIRSIANETRNTPIIAVSASAFEEDRQKILALGIDTFLRKPYRENELMNALAQQLDLVFLYQEDRERRA